MTSLLKSIFVLVSGFIIGASSSLADELVLTSEKGRLFTLTQVQDQWTRSVREARLCSDEVVTFTAFKLWMPDHGHGSTPTKILPETDLCVKVEKINFVMLGHWEIQISTEDGDKAVFNVEIK
jgi:hypothetical protein